VDAVSRLIFEKADVIPMVAETFRALGFEGATLAQITERTGLGKGSLYHFFPGGKEEMASVVLKDVDSWFSANVFHPLEHDKPRQGIATMWAAVDQYFHSGQRICLVGAFALDETRDRFGELIQNYFTRWIAALQSALVRDGFPDDVATPLAEDVVVGIQGALVLARATGDYAVFGRTLARLKLTTQRDTRPRKHHGG
jgi:TetR/AcrR family transcriptional regulator, lmrAB and yxaGH operons repressor